MRTRTRGKTETDSMLHTPASGRGFTLIELLVVIAILAILISIIMPSIAGARKHAMAVKCSTNLHHVGQAIDPVTHRLNLQTVIAIGDMTYNAGDSRFDVAGDSMGPARGAMPRGADGTVDAADVTYVTNNVFTSGQPWGTTVNHGGNILNDYLGDHAAKDLSCDMNGDLIVDSADVALVTGG